MATILDQSYSESNYTTQYGIYYDGNSQLVAMQFEPSINSSCNEVKLYLRRDNNPADNIHVEIWTDTGSNLPNTQTGASSDDVVCSSIATSYELVSFPFSAPVALTSGTKYWIVANPDYTGDASNLVSWGMDNTSPSYAEGLPALYNGSTWASNAAYDMCFYEYYDDTISVSVNSINSLYLSSLS